MHSETRTYRTGSDEVVLDLTQDAADFVADRGDGLLQVFVPHATAGIAIIETGAGSDDDLLAALGDLLPARRPVAPPPRLPGPRSLARDARDRAAPLHRPGPGRAARARAPGRASAWSTSTSTTTSARCAGPSWRGDRGRRDPPRHPRRRPSRSAPSSALPSAPPTRRRATRSPTCGPRCATRVIVLAELVAVVGDEVVGHVGVSHCWLDARRELVDVAMLSPLSTLPDHQGAGIGTALVTAAIEAARASGRPALFLEGSPAFYGSRGFEPSRRVRPGAAVAAHARGRLSRWCGSTRTPTG